MIHYLNGHCGYACDVNVAYAATGIIREVTCRACKLAIVKIVAGDDEGVWRNIAIMSRDKVMEFADTNIQRQAGEWDRKP